MNANNQVSFSVRLPPEIRAALEEAAAREHRSVTQLIRNLLTAHVASLAVDQRKAA